MFAQRDRIPDQLDSSRRVVLRGNVNLRAQPQFDRGAADPSTKLPRITLMLKPAADQQAGLERLLEEQRDPSSVNYQQWLTPEQYADRFGVSASDLGKISFWLQSQGFAIEDAARGRNWIAFSGSAGQAEAAFGTHIHRYNVDGEIHFANSDEPSVPSGIAPLVLGISGLDDFHPKPIGRIRPKFTSGGNHYLAPDDVATIYNLRPLYNSGYFGNGQSIAIIGQSDFIAADIANFRAMFNLPANPPAKYPVAPVPGIVAGDMVEADLDLEWVGAVARNANLIYVYSNDAFDAAAAAVDQVLAPIISFSFGACEPGAPFFSQSVQLLAQQANAEGITWVASSGDSGAAGCNSPQDPLATMGLAVNLPASAPEVTAVGGTEFNEATGNYWGSNGPNWGSALSYIPEKGWNDTILRSLAASTGGKSIFYPKPAWQIAPGVPNDGARDVPDLALAASADHDGFILCNNASCTSENPNQVVTLVGGTSAGTPVFAGILALLLQYQLAQSFQTAPGLGNVNPTLYRLAQNSGGTFHDITTGDNIVPCATASPDCANGSFGYTAGPGYDLVTGLGSIDASNFVTSWHTNQCTYTLPAPTTVSSQTSAFLLPITTQSGCPWTVWTNAAWIAINSAAGSGPGTASLNFSPNSSTQPRTATIYAAGQTFLLTQNPPGVTPAPSLAISKTHTGNFTRGQNNAVYTVMVSNAANAGPTNGIVTVTESIPSGLTLVSMAGAGWTCSAVSCSRSDVLNPGVSYPSITVTVNVSANAVSPQVNQVSVSGGGSSAATTSDSTNIVVITNPPTLSLSRRSLNFGINGALVTSAQTITVTFTNGPGVAWTASSNHPNIVVSPSSGSGNGTFQVSASAGSSGAITVTAAGASNTPQTITVNVNNAAPTLPYGSFDTPLNNAAGIAGAIPVTGWALDNIEVSSVKIYREPIGNEVPQPNGLIFIGDAVFVAGARPDVEASFPNSPWNYRAGWGYLLLSNILPNNGVSPGPGNGTYKLHAIATNKSGQSMDLGTRTISADNAHGSKPFGTIDTPAQGGTVSGNAFVNFGWALTQNPYVIAKDGSTITVFVDGVAQGHPAYNQYRADIANIFPGLANSNGAVGFFYIDTTTLSNGVHSINWIVSDNQGRSDGIGSRYFSVLNSSASNTTAAFERDEPATEHAVTLRRGLEGRAAGVAPDETGVYSIEVEQLENIELRLGAMAGYLVVNGERRSLPIGSSLKAGVFSWHAGLGLFGDYQLEFERAGAGAVRVRIRVIPKSS